MDLLGILQGANCLNVTARGLDEDTLHEGQAFDEISKCLSSDSMLPQPLNINVAEVRTIMGSLRKGVLRGAYNPIIPNYP